MIAVDTNLLVRYAIRDDADQAARAGSFLAGHDCLVMRSVVLETGWVLSSAYGLSRDQVVERIRHVLLFAEGVHRGR